MLGTNSLLLRNYNRENTLHQLEINATGGRVTPVGGDDGGYGSLLGLHVSRNENDME